MPTVDLNQLEPVEGNPFDMTPGILAHGYGTLSADNPSWGSRLAGAFSNAMGALGATPLGQRNAYDVAQTTSGLIPGVNNAISANQAYRDWNQGNYLGAGINAIGAAIPPVPGASNLTAGAGRGILSAVEETAQPMIRAFHGTRDAFDAFDDAHLGIGAEGPAHYFTTNPQTARDYSAPGGNIYNVKISHDPSRFLDFNATFDEQHPDVQAALKKLGASQYGNGEDMWRSLVKYDAFDDEWNDAVHGVKDKLLAEGIPGAKWREYESTMGGKIPSSDTNYGLFNSEGIKIVGGEPYDEPMVTLYHVTPTRNLQSIYENGLLSAKDLNIDPSKGGYQASYANAPGYGEVALGASKSFAQKLATGRRQGSPNVTWGGEPQSVLSVQVPVSEIKDQLDENGQVRGMFSVNKVPRDRITFPRGFKPDGQ